MPADLSAPQMRGQAVDDVLPHDVARPESIDELSEMMRTRSDEGVVVTSNASKLDFGGVPTKYDCQLDLSSLPRKISHSAGDLVVRVSANTAIQDLQRVLAEAGQRLSIDEVVPNSSVGGVVSTALSGPLRYRFGGVRDLLLGCSFVRADGQIAKAGGIVVKNVAGFDVTKLLCGSYGTLAVLTECIFRLHPVPRRRHFLIARLSLSEALRSSEAIASSTLDPTAIEINDEGDEDVELAVLIEGSAVGASKRAAAAKAMIRGEIEVRDAQPSWWAALPSEGVVKLAFEPASSDLIIRAIRAALGDTTSIRGSIALGLLTASIDQDASASRLQRALAQLREVATNVGGTVQVLRAPPRLKHGTDLFGSISSLDVMARVKDQFDPAHRLGAGRFVGGW